MEKSASLVEGLKDLAPDVRKSEVYCCYWSLRVHCMNPLAHHHLRQIQRRRMRVGGAIGVAAEAGMREGCQEQDRGKQRVMAVVQAALGPI